MKSENFNKKIFVAGHNGMVGSAINNELRRVGYKNLLNVGKDELDLRDQRATFEFFDLNKPDIVYLAAAKVGGILANHLQSGEFIADNLAIQTNVITSAFNIGVKKLLFLGSSCIYPKYSPQPIKEEYLMTGPLEPTNEAYAIAKIAGLKLCENFNRQFGKERCIDYRCVMPTNLYGPGDNYHPENSHVIPGLIQRLHEAKVLNLDEVKVWGSGNPLREFLHVDDLANACVFLMQLPLEKFNKDKNNHSSHINVGSGEEFSILELARLISNVVGYNGEIIFDRSKPDGTPRKVLDCSKLRATGWRPSIKFAQGIAQTYEQYLIEKGSGIEVSNG